jgi:hypothetical protein
VTEYPDCSIVTELSFLANKHHMCGNASPRWLGTPIAKGCSATWPTRLCRYIVFGLRAQLTADDVYARAGGSKGYNTDVVLGRGGEFVGYYRKAWPCCPAADGSTMQVPLGPIPLGPIPLGPILLCLAVTRVNYAGRWLPFARHGQDL